MAAAAAAAYPAAAAAAAAYPAAAAAAAYPAAAVYPAAAAALRANRSDLAVTPAPPSVTTQFTTLYGVA